MEPAQQEPENNMTDDPGSLGTLLFDPAYRQTRKKEVFF
jgi:hypothetical protein